MTTSERSLPEVHAQLPTISANERVRLVRLCARLSGSFEAAEDLAQETLLEAWRHADRLREPEALTPWLSGIARNVCRRWRRERGRDAARTVPAEWHPDGSGIELEELPADQLDVTSELEHAELAGLLDRALALLPEETRRVLVARYIEEASYAEIAEQLGMSEGSVAVRLHRGRLSLRRVLGHELSDEAVWHGIVIPDDARWTETRIWCRYCGRRRLHGQFDRARGYLVLRCPDCCADDSEAVVAEVYTPEHLRGIKGFKTAYWRSLDITYRLLRPTLAQSWAPCEVCGRPASLRFSLFDDMRPVLRGLHGVTVLCDACDNGHSTCLGTLALSLPESLDFWRRHQRLRTLPEREVEHEGHAAIVTSFQDVTGPAQLDVISARDTFDVLGIYRVHDA